MDIGNRVVITANITEEAIADLALGEGDQVTVLMHLVAMTLTPATGYGQRAGHETCPAWRRVIGY